VHASKEVTVCVATVSDLELLVCLTSRFRDHLQQSHPTVEELRSGLARLLADPGTEFLIALSPTGEPIGFAQLRFRFSAWLDSEAGEIEDLYVSDVVRRTGLGHRLVSLAIDRARSRRCGMIGLNTNEKNAAALSLYRAFGFDCERAFWSGGQQLWLRKTLTA
jgi:ribosomal protein S18 acetylase RimI-like enzyme